MAATTSPRAEDYVAVSPDGRRQEGPFPHFYQADAAAKKMGGYVKFLAEEALGPDLNGGADRLTAQQHAAARREAYHLERDATFVHEYLSRTNRVDLIKPHVEQVMVRCDAIRRVADGRLGEGEAQEDFDSIDAAVRHEMAAGAVGHGEVSGGVYVFYPGGMGKRVYYASGKYHVARRAEPMPQSVAPVAAECPPAVVVAQELTVAGRDVKAVRAGRKKPPLKTAEDVHKFLKKEVVDFSQEVVLVIPVDHRGQLLNPRPYVVAMGAKAEVSVKMEDVLRPVIATNAAGFFVAHNHPSGKAQPSKADMKLTEDIINAAAAAVPGVPMLDHIVEADGEFYSFTNQTLFKG